MERVTGIGGVFQRGADRGASLREWYAESDAEELEFAAYLAAARGAPVRMADLRAATQREYRKLGRLVVRAEFGTWLDLEP